jgi:nitroimidazol reductase NimA-like FMN-containing flavoprotein (pyridoxamine 5'-phosphate oxidase superfamily)
MPRPLTEQERRAFLREPHVATFSVASDDERPPLTIPVWYAYLEDDTLFFFTGEDGPTRKTRLIRKAGVVSLSVQQPELPYKFVTVEGTVVQFDQPPSAEQMVGVVRRYLPEDAAQAYVQRVVERSDPALIGFTIRPDRWISLDFTDDL